MLKMKQPKKNNWHHDKAYDSETKSSFSKPVRAKIGKREVNQYKQGI